MPWVKERRSTSGSGSTSDRSGRWWRLLYLLMLAVLAALFGALVGLWVSVWLTCLLYALAICLGYWPLPFSMGKH
jgi:hypothetical protein